MKFCNTFQPRKSMIVSCGIRSSQFDSQTYSNHNLFFPTMDSLAQVRALQKKSEALEEQLLLPDLSKEKRVAVRGQLAAISIEIAGWVSRLPPVPHAPKSDGAASTEPRATAWMSARHFGDIPSIQAYHVKGFVPANGGQFDKALQQNIDVALHSLVGQHHLRYTSSWRARDKRLGVELQVTIAKDGASTMFAALAHLNATFPEFPRWQEGVL
jgi:hypothetical protein